jgi:hypothetical protein
MADIDGDGALDLFAGGRVTPGKYPESASSLIFRQLAGKFVPDGENTRTLTNAGLVSGAVWSDLNGDGFPDLILACEWGPLKIFRNDRGKLVAWNPPVRTSTNSKLEILNQLTGWWNGVTTGDFDGDGQLDIVASNWGENTKYEALRREPLRIYYGDFDGDGSVEMIEAHHDQATKGFVPLRNLEATLRSMPWLRERFPTWTSFSKVTVDQILADKFASTKMLQASWLETTAVLEPRRSF